MNFQLQEDGTYDYKHVGDWNNGSLHIWKDMQLGQQPGVKVESVCSKPCPPGFYKVRLLLKTQSLYYVISQL